MSLSVASRRPVSARTSVSRQRAVVRCSAQPSAVSRNLLAAGAAIVLVVGPSTAPAQAFTDDGLGDENATLIQPKDAGKDNAQNLGDRIKAKLSNSPGQDAAPPLQSTVNFNSSSSRREASNGVNDAVNQGKDSARNLGDTIKANLSGNPVQDAANAVRDTVSFNPSSVKEQTDNVVNQNLGDNLKPALSDKPSQAAQTINFLKNNGNSDPFSAKGKVDNVVNKGKDNAQNLGDTIKAKLSGNPVQDAAQAVKNTVSFNFDPSSAKGKADNVVDQGKDSAQNLGDTIKAKLSGNPAQDAAQSVKNDVNFNPSSAKGAVDNAATKAKQNINPASFSNAVDGAADSGKNLVQDVQKEAQARLNPAGLRVPNPSSDNPYDNKFGDAKTNTFPNLNK